MSILVNPALGQSVKLYHGGSGCVLKDWTIGGPTPTSLVDKSGCGNNGTFGAAAAAPTPAQLASGVWYYGFDGGDYITIPQDSTLDCVDQVTMAAWIYYTGSPTAFNGYIMANGQQGVPASIGYSLYSRGSAGNEARFQVGNGVSGAPYASLNFTTCGIVTTTWYFLAGTYNKNLGSNQIKLYLNGVAVGTDGTLASNLTPAVTEAAIGNNPVIYNFPFTGRVALPRIWPTALSAADILKAYSLERKYFL